QGVAKKSLADDSKDLTPLLDMILAHVPPAGVGKDSLPLRAQPFNLGYDNFLGRLAIVRVYEGMLKTGQQVFVKKPTGETRPGKVIKIFTFKGLKKEESLQVSVGDIALV